MGGLVARYALTWMEHNNFKHDVKLYMSYDTPHWGASVSLGNQLFLRFNSGTQDAAREAYNKVVASAAARQMLLVHESSFSSGIPIPTQGDFRTNTEIVVSTADPRPDVMYTDFFNELKALGNYPSKPRKVAFANGNGLGVGQGFTAGQHLIRVKKESFRVDIDINTYVAGPGTYRAIFAAVVDIINFVMPPQINFYEQTVGAIAPAYEYAPGGFQNITRIIVEQVNDPIVQSALPAALSECFVPTLSAVDSQDRSDLFKTVAQVRTPFDAVYYATGRNEEHVQVTAEKRDQILAELARLNTHTTSPTVSPTVSPTALPTFSPSLTPSTAPTTAPSCPAEQSIIPGSLVRRIISEINAVSRELRKCQSFGPTQP
jgi:hypothetical protein